MLIGNIGADPLIQTLEGMIRVAKFSLATSESYKDDKGQMQVNTERDCIILWRGLAGLAWKYIHKGSLVYIEGKIKTRSYEDKQGVKKYVTEVIDELINLLDIKEQD